MNFERRFVGDADGILREEQIPVEEKAKSNKPLNPLGNTPGDILYGDEKGVLREEKPKAKWKEDFERSTGKTIKTSEAGEKIKEYLKNKK
jgi:hypothetical protein